MYNIFKYKKYKKIITGNGYVLKTVSWRIDKDGELSTITEFNSDDLPIYQTAYTDENFKDLNRTTKIEYNEDKSHTNYEIYTNNQGGWFSIIGKYDNKGRQLESKEFIDKDFQNILGEGIRTYNKNGSYSEKIKDYEVNKSSINYFDKKGIEKRIISFNDMNFTEIESEAKLKFKRNGNVIFYEVLKDRHPFESRETLYNSRYNMKTLSEKWYKDENFKELNCTVDYSYFDNGSYERKAIYKDYSVIEKYDKENNFLWTKYFKDTNFKIFDYEVNEENKKNSSTKDEIDKLLIKKNENKIYVNPKLYGINYSAEMTNCNYSNDTNQKNEDIAMSNQNFVRTDEVENKIIEITKQRDDLLSKCEDKNNPRGDIKEELENLRQEMQDLINPNRQYERLGVDVLKIYFSENILSIVDPDKKGSCLIKIAVLRNQLTDELGYIIPNVRLLDSKFLKPNQYSIYVRDKEVFVGEISATDIEHNNCTEIINNLKEICIKYAHQIITKTEALKIMELVKSQDPTLVNDLIPIFLSPIDLKKIMANLIFQNVSIKDIIFVFEILNDHARYTQDINELTEILKKELNFTNNSQTSP